MLETTLNCEKGATQDLTAELERITGRYRDLEEDYSKNQLELDETRQALEK